MPTMARLGSLGALAMLATEPLPAVIALACTQLVEAAMRAGGSALYYRTEGECYETLGDRLNALKAYERFCAAAPRTDPARARIQVLVRAANGRCD